jgi:ComF family protein
MLSRLSGLGGMAVDLLFPARCIGCGREGAFICQSCRLKLNRIAPPVCTVCGCPLAGNESCPACLEKERNIDGIRSPFRFDGTIRRAVHQLKYGNLWAIARPLAVLMAEHFAASPVPGEALVPMPLHPRRLRARGYNQSLLLAKELGRLIGLPVAECVARIRYVSPQARAASAVERHKNVAGCFACRRHLGGQGLIIVDDVATSGATLDACAAALKTAGAGPVWGFTLAREV